VVLEPTIVPPSDIDQEYRAPEVAVEAVLPIDPAQTALGAVMVQLAV
jgi:hypothetical protein